MATKLDTKFLVNGQPMTNKEFIELMQKARDAQKSYKSTDTYKVEQEEKTRQDEEIKAHMLKFESLAKSLKVDNKVLARIGLALYNTYKPKKEE